MSKVLEKTFGSFLNSLVGSGLPVVNPTDGYSSSLNHVSLGLITFVERLEAARKISKQEEEDIVTENYQEWLRLVSLQNTKNEVIADNLCRSLIAFCRGHYFANLHINAIKLTQSDKLLFKKIGYLYISRTLPPGSDLTVLLVNTVQRDLSSPNMIQISFGLSLLPVIMSPDVSSLISNSLEVCLTHQQPYIKRRAATMASSLILAVPDSETSISLLIPSLLRLLTDSDPSVAIAATITLSNAFKNTRECFRVEELRDEIAVGSAHILLQATRGFLSQNYNSGPINAPFVQVQMLRAIQNLCSSSWNVPQEVISAVESVLQQPWGGRNLTLYMTLIEGITTVTTLPKNDALITLTLKIILGFIKSSLVDFKYLGIKALASVFSTLQDVLTEAHLEAVLECLNSSSQLLQSRTVRLLCSMANESNYQAICVTLMEFSSKTNVASTTDFIHEHLSNFLKRIKVDIPWCVEFLSPILEAPDVAANFLQTLQIIFFKGLDVDRSEEEKAAVVPSCNKLFDILLKGDNVSLEKLTTVAFILNILFFENPKMVKSESVEIFIQKLKQIEKINIYDDNILDCLLYCGLFIPEFSEKVKSVLFCYSKDRANLNSCLKSEENLLLLESSETTKRIYAKQKQILRGEIKPDLTFTFCDSYVLDALEKGAQPYKPFTIKTRNFSRLPPLGTFNPFDTKESICSLNEEKESLSPSASIRSSQCGGSGVIGTPPIPPTLWTSKGRLRHKSESENGSLHSSGSGCVEIAHEAEENSLLNEEELQKSLPVAFLGTQKKDLAQTLLKGLGFSKQ